MRCRSGTVLRFGRTSRTYRQPSGSVAGGPSAGLPCQRWRCNGYSATPGSPLCSPARLLRRRSRRAPGRSPHRCHPASGPTLTPGYARQNEECSMRPLGIGVISFAHGHVNAYCNRIGTFDDTRLVAAWDDNEERGKANATQFGMEFAPSLSALLARDDLDAVM